MNTFAVVALGFLLIWVGYDFLYLKDLMMRWASMRNDGKSKPRTPASDFRATVVGAVLILAGVALLLSALVRLI